MPINTPKPPRTRPLALQEACKEVQPSRRSVMCTSQAFEKKIYLFLLLLFLQFPKLVTLATTSQEYCRGVVIISKKATLGLDGLPQSHMKHTNTQKKRIQKQTCNKKTRNAPRKKSSAEPRNTQTMKLSKSSHTNWSKNTQKTAKQDREKTVKPMTSNSRYKNAKPNISC